MINGRGSEQALNGNYCMHMHKGGAPHAFAASKIIIASKVGVADEANVVVAVLPDRDFASHVIQSWSDLDNF